MEASGLAPDVFVGQRRAAQAVQVQEAQLPGQLAAAQAKASVQAEDQLYHSIPYDRNLPTNSTLPGKYQALESGRVEALQTVTPENRAAVDQEYFRQRGELVNQRVREIQSRTPEITKAWVSQRIVPLENGQQLFVPDVGPDGKRDTPFIINPPKEPGLKYDLSNPSDRTNYFRDKPLIEGQSPGFTYTTKGTLEPNQEWRQSPDERALKLYLDHVDRLTKTMTTDLTGPPDPNDVQKRAEANVQAAIEFSKQYEQTLRPPTGAPTSQPATQPSTAPAGTRPLLPASPDQMVPYEDYTGPEGARYRKREDGIVCRYNPQTGRWDVVYTPTTMPVGAGR
jgi:hypothetical protein